MTWARVGVGGSHPAAAHLPAAVRRPAVPPTVTPQPVGGCSDGERPGRTPGAANTSA